MEGPLLNRPSQSRLIVTTQGGVVTGLGTYRVMLKTVTIKGNELSQSSGFTRLVTVIANTLARPEVTNTQTGSVMHLQRGALSEREIM